MNYCNIIAIILVLLNTIQFNFTFKLSLYYETLCHDSQKFMTTQLLRAYEMFGEDISVEMVPFGNVDEYRDDKGVLKFHCQHGIQECRGNKIHSCVYNDFWWNSEARMAALRFMNCMMTHNQLRKNAEIAGKLCADIFLPNHWPHIWHCATNDRGRDIYRTMARKTKDLTPSPTFIPWLTFDGAHDQNSQSMAEIDLIGFICKRVNPKPESCETYERQLKESQEL